MEKQNKVYRYSKENNKSNKLSKVYDNEFALDEESDNRPLELEKQQVRSYTKQKEKQQCKKDKNCK